MVSSEMDYDFQKIVEKTHSFVNEFCVIDAPTT